MFLYKNHKTNNPNVDVHITYTQHDPKVVLRGYAIDSDTGIKLDGAKTLKRTASCDEDVPRAEFHLITAVMDSLHIKQPIVKRTSIAPGELDSENAMVQAFTALKNANDPIHAEWNGDTKDRRLHYFEHHILPHLQQYVTEEFLPSDLALLRQRLLDSILSSGKSKGIPKMAEKTADRNLSNAAVIYGRMRKCNPALPDIALAPLRRVKSVDHEPPKYIPEVVRQRCYRNLESQVDSAPIKVYGTVLMVDGALRTSESAGTLPCDITFDEDNAYVEVLWQEHEGKRIPRLKTDNAYRMVPLSYWGTTMIRRCIERIGTIPVETTSPLMRSQDLSAWILQMLRECGCDEEFFDQAIEEMYAHPDRNKDGTPNYDLAAYIWRRDRTERWRNICGLTCNPNGDSEIDYLLGHMTPHKRRKYDYRLPEKQAEIARKLERYVYSFELSKHPAIAPIEVVHGFDYDLMPFDQTCICNTSEAPLVIRCDFESSEPNEAITIIAPTKGICLDSDPFPSLPKRKLSTEAKHKKAVTPEELSLDMQDALYEYLKSNINSPNCGIALQPWGGFSAKDACSLLWKDVEFDPIRKDFARIKFRRDDLAGATHDFTRPIFPQAAILLRLRYEQLLCDYPPEVLSLFPVVSTKTNPQKAMTPDALTQYAGMILRTIGISETVFASLKSPKEAVSKKLLINTYIKNVMLRSNLTDDPGTASFLFGESLRSSTTDDHYSSFVSPDAAERIHTAMKAITPVEPFPALISKTVTKDGSEEHTYHPETTRQSVGVVCDIVLQPGEKLEVLCPHGVTGSIRTRRITESGIQRKSVSHKKSKTPANEAATDIS